MPRTTKKTTTKKTVRKSAPVAAAEPVMHECQCGGNCPCGCHHGKFKKFIVLLIVFLLGFAVAKITCCHRGHHMRMGPKMHPVFQNGCLDMASVHCPKMAEALQVSAANADGCITKEEFKDIKKDMHREIREDMPKPEESQPVDAE